MSRFKNLEFGEDGAEPVREAASAKDECFYLSEAQAAFEKGRFEQALRAYAKVLEFNPRRAEAWTGQVRMLLELGEFREAKLWADKALESFPEDPELLAAKAVALARTGDLKAALLFSDSSVELAGHTAYIWMARGDVLLAHKEKRAEFCFDKALSLAPESWLVPWLIARIYAFYQRFATALKLAQQALNLDPTRASVWLDFGRCQQSLGLSQLAENSYAQAAQLDPSLPALAVLRQQATQLSWWERLRGRFRQLFPS